MLSTLKNGIWRIALLLWLPSLAFAQDAGFQSLTGQDGAQASIRNSDEDIKTGTKSLLEIKPVALGDKDDELRRLLKERFNTAVEEMQFAQKIYEAELSKFDSVSQAGKRVMESGLELYDDPKERIQLLTNYVAVTKMYESIEKLRFRGNMEDASIMLQARYHRLDAEILLAKEKKKLEAKPAK